MSTPIRWILLVVGSVGAVLSSLSLFGLLEIIRTNGVTDGAPVGLREHYLQLGAFYSRGFTTGFFFCFSLMLLAVAAGTWYDERRRARGQRALQAAAFSASAPTLREG